MRNLWDIDLMLFSEGAAENTAGGENAGENAESAQPQQTGDTGAEKENADGADAAHSEKADEFEEMIRGKYREKFNGKVTEIVKKRLHTASEKFDAAQQQLKMQDALLKKLYVRYNVKDIDGLNEALKKPELAKGAAEREGMSPEVYLELEKYRAEEIAQNEEKSRRASAEEIERRYIDGRMHAREQYEIWEKAAEEVKNTYPDFDLENELKNPNFKALITSKNPEYSISMLEAYRMLHYDELIAGAESAAVEKMTKAAAARAARPTENAVGAQNALKAGAAVSSLTKKERAELARRAERGERITF